MGQRGFALLSVAPTWTYLLHTPQSSDAALWLAPRSICESICASQVDEPCGECLLSCSGNDIRIPLSRMRHGVSVLGNRRMDESLKSVVYMKSGTCVWLWQEGGGWFSFHYGDGVLCSSLELFLCKAPHFCKGHPTSAPQRAGSFASKARNATNNITPSNHVLTM